MSVTNEMGTFGVSLRIYFCEKYCVAFKIANDAPVEFTKVQNLGTEWSK